MDIPSPEIANAITEEVVERAAKTAHEVNRAYCAGIGDDSHLAWEHAPDWQRESVLGGVHRLMADPNASPEVMHDNWFKKKQDEGWVYGEVKDPEEKTHPCCRPYAHLPLSERIKDDLFSASVRGVLAKALEPA